MFVSKIKQQQNFVSKYLRCDSLSTTYRYFHHFVRARWVFVRLRQHSAVRCHFIIVDALALSHQNEYLYNFVCVFISIYRRHIAPHLHSVSALEIQNTCWQIRNNNYRWTNETWNGIATLPPTHSTSTSALTKSSPANKRKNNAVYGCDASHMHL